MDFRAELEPLLKLPSAGGEPEADRAVVPESSSGVHRLPSTRILRILSVPRGFVVREHDSYAEDSPSKGIGLEATNRPGITPDPIGGGRSECGRSVHPPVGPFDRCGPVTRVDVERFCEAVQSLAQAFVEQVRGP
jgi:hypothetical protein